MAIQGNNIFSTEEEELASYLKMKNLEHANVVARTVHPKKTLYTKIGKRLVDLIIIIPVMIILSPIYIILAATNLIDMGKPILFKQTRYGYRGKNYNILKFRSMRNLVDAEGRQLPPDQRLTKYGRFIRKVSLDELPNFYNILKGEMSIIGPRAVPVFYLERMTERHKKMSEVRPGLECPIMINLKAGDNISKYEVIFENNIWYVENISLFTDVKMFFKLIKMVFSMGERTKHASAASFFVGYDEEGRALSLKLAYQLYKDQIK